jgi:hypothetical protein
MQLTTMNNLIDPPSTAARPEPSPYKRGKQRTRLLLLLLLLFLFLPDIMFANIRAACNRRLSYFRAHSADDDVDLSLLLLLATYNKFVPSLISQRSIAAAYAQTREGERG